MRALRIAEAIYRVISFCFDSGTIHARNGLPIVYHAALRRRGGRSKVRVLRLKPNFPKFAAIVLIALIGLAAMSEGFISRDLLAALAAGLSTAALAAALMALRESREMRRSAQDYFAKIENAARRLERGQSGAPAAPVTGRAAPAAHKPAEAAAAPRLVHGVRPTVIEGGKAKAERISAEMSAADDALLVAINAHAVPVSLEPVVELQTSKVAAYRVHAHICTADGQSVSLRRLAGAHPGIDPARFDMELFHAAAGAARRFPGASAEETPLICPLSGATLSSPKDLRKIVAMMNNIPSLKSSLVFEIPAAALDPDDIMLSGAGLLADAAARLAGEGVLHTQRLNEIAGRFEFEFWSISGSGAGAREGGRDFLALAGSEARLIASDLAEDHDVIAMIDAGVTLACGPRFSDPMPVRQPGAENPSDRDRLGSLS